MKVHLIRVEAFEITDAPSLDPIRVIIKDYGIGQGRIIIDCFGSAWSSYWGAMGSSDIKTFFIHADVEYLVDNLLRGKRSLARERSYLRRIVIAVQDALRLAPYADDTKNELLEWVESIENDDGKIPAWLWEKIQAAVAKAKGGQA